MPEKSLRGRLRLGLIVFGALVGTKIIEYLISRIVYQGAWPYLIITIVVGAWLIYCYFMHIRQLWRSGRDDD